MKIYLLPYESITIYTRKSEEELIVLLENKFNQRTRNDTKFSFTSETNCFLIQKKLNNNSGTLIIANGSIFSDVEIKTVIIDITAKDNYAVVFAIIWYGLNLSFFLFFVYLLIRDWEFQFSIFLPPFFILLGYGFTTATMQGGIDQLVEEIDKTIK